MLQNGDSLYTFFVHVPSTRNRLENWFGFFLLENHSKNRWHGTWFFVSRTKQKSIIYPKSSHNLRVPGVDSSDTSRKSIVYIYYLIILNTIVRVHAWFETAVYY